MAKQSMTTPPKGKTRRRQRRGAAWYWKQTDCWYYTPRGTKRREPLLDDQGKRIRGRDGKQAAQLAIARLLIKHGLAPTPEIEPSQPTADAVWPVARVCSKYVAHCARAVAAGKMHPEHRDSVIRYLKQLSRYCGALPVAELKRGYVAAWVESQPTWRSPVTRRDVIAIVLAAFNYAQNEYDVRNPLKGLKKPPPRPRLHSITPEEEQAIYGATDQVFRDFVFAAIHTGLRPFCELAKITADDIEVTDRGMMWRVYSSKTKKTRKIPVRPEVAALTRKLMKTSPRGSGLPLFRNSQGNPWKKVTGVHRFLSIKRKLGWIGDDPRARYSNYSARHSFAHKMLAGFWNGGVGCSIEVLAELMGDTPSVAYLHYGREWSQTHQSPLWAAIGEGQ